MDPVAVELGRELFELFKDRRGILEIDRSLGRLVPPEFLRPNKHTSPDGIVIDSIFVWRSIKCIKVVLREVLAGRTNNDFIGKVSVAQPKLLCISGKPQVGQ